MAQNLSTVFAKFPVENSLETNKLDELDTFVIGGVNHNNKRMSFEHVVNHELLPADQKAFDAKLLSCKTPLSERDYMFLMQFKRILLELSS